ncbi:sacsin N-terminal ATP-binding-like domain-containing protein [Kineococcus rubinsiae]|uniref:sacsin N-terminal ATP-binding-like domain-containing protein n=1 Tax=Kineococcus rubinsiae TaxID=2609562 RepID=UPI001431B0F7|nr:hypothetical protein [Kineococcus rubinsiae]NIZ92794.1 hypothetical protein [Kineococcus rubinsiae]
MTGDPFDTAAVRERVLAAWAASPARLREDANAEEDASLGGYRDRLVVELAQNAADAAARAGTDGRLLLRLETGATGPGRLLAANTGAPLDAAGVEGLATLRASGKRDGGDALVGRFGVGFSAVLAVTDDPAVVGTAGGVRFSRSATRALVRERAAAAPGLGEELDRRAGHVPALRLPFPETADGVGGVPAGCDTAVDLPLRDAAAVELATALLEAADDVLLLALPALAEVVVELPGREPRVLRDVHRRWRVLRRTGRHDEAALADRGVEERGRLGWQVTWALPLEPGTPRPGVVCAPTPTDEDLPWPAVLVASFPLGPDRRRLAPGPATERVLDAAADAYVDLLVEVAGEAGTGPTGAREEAAGGALALLPYGAAAGRVDAELRTRVLDRARSAPLLRAVETADGLPILLRPADAVALTGAGADDPALLAALAPVLAGLVAAPREVDRLLTDLGVVRLSLADALEVLPGTGPPASFRALYAALRPLAHDAAAREAMASLPVPLLDGRVVHGARGLVQLDTDLAGGEGLSAEGARLLAGHGLRLVHPDAADELLERLGARSGGARAVLTDPAVAAAVADSPDADDPDAVADAVLSLVAAAVGEGPEAAGRAARIAEELGGLGDLALPDADGDLAPASALVLPGSLAARTLDPDAVAAVDPDLLADWGPDVLRAVGVLDGPAVVVLPELDLEEPDEDATAGVAGLAEYAEAVWGDTEQPQPADVLVVRDLDLVVDGWPEVLAALAATPAGTAALTRTWAVAGVRRTPLAAWWLRRHGPLPPVSRDPAAAHPAWLPVAPAWTAELPEGVRRALGVLPALAAAGPDDVPALLEAAARAPEVPAADLLALWALLAVHADAVLPAAEAPRHLRVLGPAGTTRTVAADDVVVADSPAWAQRDDLGPQLLVPARVAERVADLLDLDLASDRADGSVTATGARDETVPPALATLLPGAPPAWRRAATLAVDGCPVRWWVEDGAVLAVDEAAAADGLASAAGRWELRRAAAALLLGDDAERARVLAAELPGLGAAPAPGSAPPLA